MKEAVNVMPVSELVKKIMDTDLWWIGVPVNMLKGYLPVTVRKDTEDPGHVYYLANPLCIPADEFAEYLKELKNMMKGMLRDQPRPDAAPGGSGPEAAKWQHPQRWGWQWQDPGGDRILRLLGTMDQALRDHYRQEEGQS